MEETHDYSLLYFLLASAKLAAFLTVVVLLSVVGVVFLTVVKPDS